MAQDSIFWDGTTTGHAASTDLWSAPYSSAEMSDLLSTLLGSDAARAYVIPGYGNNMKVQANSPTALNVVVKSGRIFSRGRLYGNTGDETLTIGAADATNPRLDRIVARISFSSQTITLAVLAGTAAATPSLPALTQNSTTYELSLAYVWVAAATATIADTDIHDERIFAPNFESLYNSLAQNNLLTNSEFMSFSRLDSDGVTDAGAPDGGWQAVGTVTSYSSQTRPSQMSRGRAVRITAGAATSGISQSTRVRASTVYSIKGLINVTAGDVGQVIVTTDSASPSTITRNIRRTGAWIEINILYTTESDASTLTLSLLGLNNTDIVDFGQWLIVEGYQAGSFRQIHELIMFDFLLSDPDFDGDTFVATGSTTIDLDSDYQGIVLPGTKAICLHVQMGQTSANVTYFSVERVGSANYTLQFGNAQTAYTASYEGIVPIDPSMRCQFTRTLSGANNLTLGVYIKGILV